MAVEHQLDRTVFRLAARSDDVERAVAEALPGARQPQFWRIDLQVRELDDAVIAALEAGGQRREPAGQVAEKAVVEPPDPSLGGADNMAALVVRAGYHLEVGDHVDDAEAGNHVTLHRAR